ncbi:MAG: hypothetical protein LBL24_04375 [Bacteroidales bacterium]|jgi:hypothetical protein|nr:hypothetical protein [Bacteroidales bacterium]
MQFNERVLKIIDTYEGGSKAQFAKKTGLKSQAYNLLKPLYKPRKITIDKVLSAYPQVSEQWLVSDIGEVPQRKDEKTDKFDLAELPDRMTAHQVLAQIMKYTGSGSLVKLSVKLNIKPNDLNQVYNGTKPMGGKLARIIHKIFPEIPYNWIKTGENPYKPQSSPIKKEKIEPQDKEVEQVNIKPQIQTSSPRKKRKVEPQDQVEQVSIQPQIQKSSPRKKRKMAPQDQVEQSNIKPQIQTPVKESVSDKIQESIDSKSYVQEVELRLQTILKIHEALLSDYQKLIEMNHRLTNTVVELSGKILFLP